MSQFDYIKSRDEEEVEQAQGQTPSKIDGVCLHSGGVQAGCARADSKEEEKEGA